jgi:hypothetical protein
VYQVIGSRNGSIVRVDCRHRSTADKIKEKLEAKGYVASIRPLSVIGASIRFGGR